MTSICTSFCAIHGLSSAIHGLSSTIHEVLHKEQIHACFEQHNPLNPLFAYNKTIYTSSTMHAQINIHIPNKQLLSSVVSLCVSKWLALLSPTGYLLGLHNLVVQ